MYRFIAAALLGVPLVGALGACGADEAGEVDEHPAVVVTEWNDSTELFLEYPHPVAGRAMGNWAIHLTNMKDFRPVTEGNLRVRFLQGDREIQAFELEAPARDGIYLLDPVIRDPGVYRVELALSGRQVSSLHVLPEVRAWAEDEALPEEEEEPEGIAFLKEQQWVIPFAVEAARERPVRRVVAAPGEVAAPDGALAEVSSPVTGIAEAALNRGAPSAGEAVREGQVLVVLTPGAGEGGYARTLAEVERLERELARSERLFAAGAIPERRLERARHDLEVARAEIAGLVRGEDGDFRLRVTAPIAGVIARRSFVAGGRVTAGAPLFTIVDPATVWMRVQLPAGAAAALPSDALPTFTVEGIDRTFETTRRVAVGSALDPRTRTVPAVFEVPNASGELRIGQFGRALVPVGGSVTGIAIPNDAIVDDNGTAVAYVQLGGETFERRVLVLGERDATHTLVLGGIEAGEMVVTTGGYQVRLASLSGDEFAGGHHH